LEFRCRLLYNTIGNSGLFNQLSPLFHSADEIAIVVRRTPNMTENIDQKTKSIDRFLADNPDFEKLSSQLSQFNVFSALKIEQFEIRHSNFLAWLLDPQESHGLSEIVLRSILSNILLLAERTFKGISAAKVELMSFTDIEVVREWHRNIDILVVDRSNNIVLFFENKIHSGESKGQLVKYKKLIENEFAGFTIIPVFLTLTGQKSSDTDAIDYICYSYIQLHTVLDKLYLQRKMQLVQPVEIFIKHYLDILRRLTMQDQELINLCKAIYRKHREAIDMIVEYGKISAFQQVMEDLLKKEGDFEIHYSSPAYVWFIPLSWTKWIPENGVAWTSLKRPLSVCCWIEDWQDYFAIHFEVSKMDDPDLRLRLVNALKDEGFKLSNKAFDKNATYSRFYRQHITVNDKSDYNEVYDALKKLLEKAKKEFPKAEGVFRKVFGPKD
jgi:hypothetical protein